jgi:hypothetical protein
MRAAAMGADERERRRGRVRGMVRFLQRAHELGVTGTHPNRGRAIRTNPEVNIP